MGPGQLRAKQEVTKYYYDHLFTGVTRDAVNTFEQVFTAYKSVQIRCIFDCAAEILRFRCAFGPFLSGFLLCDV